jgi:cytochrome c biogenesis protein CcmG/thiol:disulfide interchange protein DsbE
VRRLILIVLVLGFLVACSGDTPPQGPAVEAISGVAPVLEGETLTGGTLAPPDYAGQVVVVNLWATWCGPCRREQPILTAADEEAGTDGPFFLGIDERDDREAALAWIEDFEVTYPSLSDPSGYLAYRFGAPFLPVTIVIDAEGRLRYRVVGEIDRETLDRLVREASVPKD